jgi:hypothetical protein
MLNVLMIAERYPGHTRHLQLAYQHLYHSVLVLVEWDKREEARAGLEYP